MGVRDSFRLLIASGVFNILSESVWKFSSRFCLLFFFVCVCVHVGLHDFLAWFNTAKRKLVFNYWNVINSGNIRPWSSHNHYYKERSLGVMWDGQISYKLSHSVLYTDSYFVQIWLTYHITGILNVAFNILAFDRCEAIWLRLCLGPNEIYFVNSLAPLRFKLNCRWVISKLILVVNDWCISCETALIGVSVAHIYDKST